LAEGNERASRSRPLVGGDELWWSRHIICRRCGPTAPGSRS